ncbi:hypothetical protein FDA94_29500 [Herbidospora galbida]|uniref:Uncharacterized protein n=1 Tax=Herbidospora galbida TaxID=2575442 RepID=A0A4U3M6E1_9ACTN|nr:hypothetical protein [Herbidospora galbida]TKK84478.1 hypothetical protein FDA94_29500 [Herbidospora galbida]
MLTRILRPWSLVALVAAVVPIGVLAHSEGVGSVPPMPVGMAGTAFPGAGHRGLLYPVDVFVIGVMPLLVAVALLATSRIPGIVVGVVCGLLGFFHLVELVDSLPSTISVIGLPVDETAGSRPDHYLGTRPDGAYWGLAVLAYGLVVSAFLRPDHRPGRKERTKSDERSCQ